MNLRLLALFAAFSTAIIYGVSYTVAKDVMPLYILPYALIFFRVIGSAALFWAVSFFIKNQKIQPKDYARLLLCALLGTSMNMLFFYKGLNTALPIVASAIAVVTPLMVFIFSIILLKEKLSKTKIIGLLVGLIGAYILITYKHDLKGGAGSILGNFYVFLNAAFFGLYLVVVKKLLAKYNPIHIIKWMYTISIFIVLPFSYSELFLIDWVTMPNHIYFELIFIVVFTTFINYMFNLFALTELKPTTVSVFVYLHPVFASLYALLVGSDTLSAVKIGTTLLICVGVYLVTKPAAKPIN
ncbi:DMT family transporter [Flavicella marina]|uniref:DMT family transporter n=1 Tax=Flavicella marina TaxID=1475951 RepID=UPI00126505E0|nr:DMT family transporter [Flavicella marina]